MRTYSIVAFVLLLASTGTKAAPELVLFENESNQLYGKLTLDNELQNLDQYIAIGSATQYSSLGLERPEFIKDIDLIRNPLDISTLYVISNTAILQRTFPLLIVVDAPQVRRYYWYSIEFDTGGVSVSLSKSGPLASDNQATDRRRIPEATSTNEVSPSRNSRTERLSAISRDFVREQNAPATTANRVRAAVSEDTTPQPASGTGESMTERDSVSNLEASIIAGTSGFAPEFELQRMVTNTNAISLQDALALLTFVGTKDPAPRQPADIRTGISEIVIYALLIFGFVFLLIILVYAICIMPSNTLLWSGISDSRRMPSHDKFVQGPAYREEPTRHEVRQKRPMSPRQEPKRASPDLGSSEIHPVYRDETRPEAQNSTRNIVSQSSGEQSQAEKKFPNTGYTSRPPMHSAQSDVAPSTGNRTPANVNTPSVQKPIDARGAAARQNAERQSDIAERPKSEKLELALAYKEMGDSATAKRLLQELASKGSVEEATFARELLKNL